MSGIKAILLSIATLFSGSCFGAEKIDPARTVYIDDVIEQKDLKPLGAQMLKWSKEDGGAINLIINSPGGEVYAGYEFVSVLEAVKANGTPVRCYTSQLAASMAFQILLHCSERHALKKAFFLFHRVRVVIQAIVTGPAAKALARELMAADSDIYAELEQTMGMDLDDLSYHFEHETLHSGVQLSALSSDFFEEVSESIPGLMEIVYGEHKTDGVLRASMFRRQDIFMLLRGHSLMYISPNYVQAMTGIE